MSPNRYRGFETQFLLKWLVRVPGSLPRKTELLHEPEIGRFENKTLEVHSAHLRGASGKRNYNVTNYVTSIVYKLQRIKIQQEVTTVS
jgi:hypothetical protein